MNRLVLIGNGFDLAHGLKTRYEDFLNWYWNDVGRRLLMGTSKSVSDDLCSFLLNDIIGVPMWGYVWGHHYQRKNPLEPWDIVNL